MASFGFRWNVGMTVAMVLLVVGGGLVVAAAEGTPLHAAGFGIVIVAGVVYLGARVAMLMRDPRRMR